MLKRAEFAFDLKLLTPLHVGNGETKAVMPAGSEPKEKSHEVALLQRGKSDAPWIPGSTIKGALADVARRVKLDHGSWLFGLPHEVDNSSKVAAPGQGLLTVFGCTILEPFRIDIARRTSIAHGTGVAESGKLFAIEQVQEGAKFSAKIVLRTRNQDKPDQPDFDELVETVKRLLGAFADPAGLAIGADKADGDGRVTLSGEITVTLSELTPEGWDKAGPAHFTPSPLDGIFASFDSLDLFCRGPYLTRGGVKSAPVKKPGDNEEKSKEVTMPKRRSDGKPAIDGSGISGALRKRAQDLLARDTPYKQDDATKIIAQTSSGPANLDVIQRLFGYEGYRGSLSIAVAAVDKKGVSRHPSVRLDPISQAPYQHALFEIEADYGVSFRLDLNWFREPQDDERTLANRLIADIRQRGVELGMGTTKGFGWFLPARHTDRDPRTPTSEPPFDNAPIGARLEALPDRRITLPYRFSEVDLGKIGQPEEESLKLFRDGRLHSDLRKGRYSGSIRLSWVVDTPLLIGDGGDPTSPQMIGTDYIIPGTTLRGMIRSIVETATNARMQKLNDVMLDGSDSRRSFKLQQSLRKIKRISTPQEPNPHRPIHDETYEPDFAETLFGYVHEPDDTSQDGGHADHDALHLKSRVSFGFAWLEEPEKAHVDDKPREIVMMGPDPTATFYDHIGRKMYFSTKADAAAVMNRLEHTEKASANAANRKTVSRLCFLHPGEDEPMVFRSEIRAHNVSEIEMGAIIWALTLGLQNTRRHQIGHAKPYGAGRALVRDLHMAVHEHETGQALPRYPSEIENFQVPGGGAKDFAVAFVNYLKTATSGINGLDGLLEPLNARDPAIGQALRDRSSLAASDVGYQTSRELGNQKEDIRSANNGRIAAMLKKAPR